MSKKPGDAIDVEVKVEDQQNINTFNRLNMRMHEIEAEISAKKTLLEDHEDADNELMLADEEEVRYVVGECFLQVSLDNGQEMLTEDTDAVKGSIRDLEEELGGIKGSMADLKKVLYAKFGSAINLEE